ncbi:myosin IC heavy chain-like [Balaenoptera musculus]|uniref:Myosin IC heavy chain-like n=1 Tax=Balaenoptera musculus TaxID=9771 RepID=A0A8B8YQ08_BALMU|nr:myosin IC heavy chain-like [Balaenoptera musculus]
MGAARRPAQSPDGGGPAARRRRGPGRAGPWGGGARGPPSGGGSARRQGRPRRGSRPGGRPLLLPALLDGLTGRPSPDARGRRATRRSCPPPRASPPAPGRADPVLSGPGPGADGGRAGVGGPEPAAPPGRGGPGEEGQSPGWAPSVTKTGAETPREKRAVRGRNSALNGAGRLKPPHSPLGPRPPLPGAPHPHPARGALAQACPPRGPLGLVVGALRNERDRGGRRLRLP